MEGEFTKLQFLALPEVMARALPTLTKRTASADGKISIASGEMRRTWWDNSGSDTFPLLSQVACKLLLFHVTSCATERNWSKWGRLIPKARNRLALERAEKLITIMGDVGDEGGSSSQVEEDDILLQLLGADASTVAAVEAVEVDSEEE